MASPKRVAVFIDAQNAYRSARRVFFDDKNDPGIVGQFAPDRLAELVVARGEDERELHSVHAYRGRPNQHLDPKGHSANVKQCQVWAQSGVVSHIRQLRYLNSWPDTPPEEKGIDVELAVSLVSMSLRAAIDVAVIVSADTDLRPAVDEALAHSAVAVEVVGWHNGKWGQRLTVPGQPVWCHWLTRDDYKALRDGTDYNAA